MSKKQSEGKIIKVLQFSSRSADSCGVGKYQEQFVHEVGMDTQSLGVETTFFDSSPYRTRLMNEIELKEEVGRLKNTLIKDSYDILHIQHEFGLYHNEEFAKIVTAAKEAGVRVVVTVHLSPALAFKFKPREGVGLRSAVHVVRQRRLHNIFKQRHIEPFNHADLLITHNNGATASLIDYGVNPKKILQIKHPVIDKIQPNIVSTEIAENLNRKEGDTIFATVGFMHKYKGFEDAVRALKYLPETYKLAIIGGMQPISDEKNIYNHLCNVVDSLNLKERVYITGYVESDDRLNALIREADVCVYPYNNAYYGQVSSGALNLAFANDVPVIAYPTDSFKESNDEFGQITLTTSAAYYELARELKRVDVSTQKKAIAHYASKYSWQNSTRVICDAYKRLLTQ